jgi:hypothetical protein
VVGLGRFELPTPRLSSVCSNQLSYRPLPRPSAPGSQRTKRRARSLKTGQEAHERLRTPFDLLLLPSRRRREKLLRKEVIQPQVPLRLPCYDFTPVTSHSLGAAFPCGLGKPLLEQLTPMV